MTRNTDRRTFLIAAGSAAATVALAGCSDDDNGDDGNGDGNGNGDVPEEVDQYLTDNEANLYDGTVEDHTGEGSITIMNGAGEDGLAFDPTAVRIDSGTEVTWEWTGEGGGHNVVSTESPEEFESDDGELIDEEGHTWSYTFENTGNYMYECTAHTALGQHGAIIVE